jgi:hypothetical protein
LYWKRKDWPKFLEYTEKALAIIPPHLHKSRFEGFQFAEAKFYMMLGNAAEGEGNDALAKAYDDKAFALLKAEARSYSQQERLYFPKAYSCGGRRKALEALEQGDPAAAVEILRGAVQCYVLAVEPNGLDIVCKEMGLLPLIDAVKVYCIALQMTGDRDNIMLGHAILADVRETEAIWEGYEQGVLEEARRELAEKRGAAAATSAAAVQGAGGGGVAKKKSKAAKRKQQKREAQQKKKAAARSEVGNAESEKEERVQGEEEEQEQDEQAGQTEETAMVENALKGLTVQVADEKEEEEEEEECSVCLCALGEGGGRGPELLCGHSYHLSCLTFWKEKCISKAIEPTCPYCRAPIQEK